MGMFKYKTGLVNGHFTNMTNFIGKGTVLQCLGDLSLWSQNVTGKPVFQFETLENPGRTLTRENEVPT